MHDSETEEIGTVTDSYENYKKVCDWQLQQTSKPIPENLKCKLEQNRYRQVWTVPS